MLISIAGPTVKACHACRGRVSGAGEATCFGLGCWECLCAPSSHAAAQPAGALWIACSAAWGVVKRTGLLAAMQRRHAELMSIAAPCTSLALSGLAASKVW